MRLVSQPSLQRRAFVTLLILLLYASVIAISDAIPNLWFLRGGNEKDRNKKRDESLDASEQSNVTSQGNATRTSADSVSFLQKQGISNGLPQSVTPTASQDHARGWTSRKKRKQDKSIFVDRRKLSFLDRIALISSSLIRRESDANLDQPGESTATISLSLTASTETTQGANDYPDEAITPQSDLTRPGRHFHIVTTASLPWATGTAVNPLLRAAYLHRRTQDINRDTSTAASLENNTITVSSRGRSATMRWVTLVVPWLELPEDQEELYSRVFENPEQQEAYIRDWLRDQAGMPDVACPSSGLKIVFYPARYHGGLRSIFAMGDIMNALVEEEPNGSALDVCILEEPEHCNWFRAPGDGWTQRFQYVVGIVHTNYKEYAAGTYSGLWTAPAIAMISSAMIRAYCHQVIKLSAVLQTYAPEKEEISNVHGVRIDFLEEGRRRAAAASDNVTDWLGSFKDGAPSLSWYSMGRQSLSPFCSGSSHQGTSQVYFIGKLLWAKGFDIMLELQEYYKQCTGEYFDIDIYGSGPDQKEITRAFFGRKEGSKKRSASPTSNASVKTSRKDGADSKTVDSVIAEMSSDDEEDEPFDDDYIQVEVVGDGPDNSRETVLDIKNFRSRWEASLKEAKRKFATKLRKRIEYAASDFGEKIPKSFAELRRRSPIPATFCGRADHAMLTDYKIFVNPSVSEVLCTTTAEALAMGKFVIIPYHPSNMWFLTFPNCLAYRNKLEFVANLRWALTHDPIPLTTRMSNQFTWEAATDRLVEASAITWSEAKARERLGRSKLDERIAWFHNELGKGVTGDMIRKILGGGPVADQVKYTYEMLQAANVSDEDPTGAAGAIETKGTDDSDSDSEDDGGLRMDGEKRKFRRSSFAEAFRATIADASSFFI